MKIRLMEEFEEHMPETTKYALGYIEGRQSTKRWICCEDDLNAMYTNYASYPDYCYGVTVEVVRIVMRSIPKVSDIRVM